MQGPHVLTEVSPDYASADQNLGYQEGYGSHGEYPDLQRLGPVSEAQMQTV